MTAERATVAIEPDRNAYRAKDIAPAAANASEVLDAVPSVQVDGDGKVSLRGNENVAVQINGRPSPIRGTQLGAFLKGLPANIVERIEVIPNPSAKYDPEGMAGIINIVLKQNTDLGVSGGLNAGIAEADRYNGSGNIGYQSGPLTTFSSLGFYSDDRGIVGINDRERLDALRAPLSITEQDIEGQNANVGQNLTTNVDYKLNPRDVFSNALSINHRHSTDESVSANTELNGSRTLLEKYDRPRDANTKSWMFDYTTAFKRTFEPRKHELSAELRFNRSDDKDRTALWKEPFTGTTTGPGTRLEAETDDTDALTQQLIGQSVVGRGHVVRPTERHDSDHTDDDSTGELLLSCAGEHRARPIRGDADGELLDTAEAVRRQGVSEPARPGSVQHDEVQDQCGRR